MNSVGCVNSHQLLGFVKHRKFLCNMKRLKVLKSSLLSRVMGLLVCWFVDWFVGWFVGWLVGLLVGWFVGWLVVWLVGCFEICV